MTRRKLLLSFLIIYIAIHPSTFYGQDHRSQYPSFIAGKLYTEVTAGYVSFPFTDKNLLPGFTTEKIDRPHVGVRLALIGYQFTKNISAQISYMRPVFWVYYKNVNNDHVQHTVTVNVSSVMLRGKIQTGKRSWLYGEAGMALVTRSGFYVGAPHVLKDASYGWVSFGSGWLYHISKKWALMTGLTFTPKNDKVKQPYSLSATAGFHYQLQPLAKGKVILAEQSSALFRHGQVQIGFTTEALGYGVNNVFANKYLPIFWAGNVKLNRGVSVHYQRNFFHTRKVFSMDWGASGGYWKSSVQGRDFYTISVYPLFRFCFMRKKKLDLYAAYSVAGPTYISMTEADGIKTGSRFTFQDFMGAGIYAGKDRRFNAELRIMHFSNGGLFPINNGVQVPLSFLVGYAF